MKKLKRKIAALREKRRLDRQEIWIGLAPCGCMSAWMVAEKDAPYPNITPAVEETLRNGLVFPAIWVRVRGRLPSHLSPMNYHPIIEGKEFRWPKTGRAVVTDEACDRLDFSSKTCSRPAVSFDALAVYLHPLDISPEER